MSPMFRTALVLGLLAAAEAFAIDMYLPALPQITEDLRTSEATMQLTLTLYFMAFGLAQMIYGPIADQVGRKPPLYAGMGIFLLGSVGSAVAPDIAWLIAARILQGAGAAAAMVVPRAIIRDMYTGPEATRLMALVMLVISISPMLAPLAGSGLLAVAGWRSIFWVLAAVSLLGLALIRWQQPETLAPEYAVPVNIASLAGGCRTLLAEPVFMGLTLVGAFGFASFFVFIAAAPFVYSGEFGLSPTQFSLAFAVNAIGFFATSQLAAPIGERVGMQVVMFWAVVGFAVFCVGLFVVALLGGASLFVVMGGLFLANACLGFVVPTVMVMALDPHGEIAGLASSLGGTLQMILAGLVVTLAGPFFDGTVVPMTGAVAGCGVLTLATALWVRPKMEGMGKEKGGGG